MPADEIICPLGNNAVRGARMSASFLTKTSPCGPRMRRCAVNSAATCPRRSSTYPATPRRSLNEKAAPPPERRLAASSQARSSRQCGTCPFLRAFRRHPANHIDSGRRATTRSPIATWREVWHFGGPRRSGHASPMIIARSALIASMLKRPTSVVTMVLAASYPLRRIAVLR